MANKNLYDAITILLDSMDANDAKRVYSYFSKRFMNIIEGESIGILKNSNMIVGGIGKSIAFFPVGIYIEGWFFPTNAYDKVEIYSQNYYLGDALTGISRMDVYNNFPFFNEKNAGFHCFITNYLDVIEKNKNLTVVLKLNNKIVKKASIKLNSWSVINSIDEIKNSIHEDNNILVPTLSNRLPMLVKIAKKMPNYNFITLIEGMENDLGSIYSICKNKYGISREDLNYLSLFMIPDLFRRNNIPAVSSIELSENEITLCKDNYAIEVAAENFARKFNVTLEYSIKMCLSALSYMNDLIKYVRPKAIMLWNKYNPWHQMAELAAKSRNIPVVYMENGLLPGTLIFETQGQMGESYPAVHSMDFKKLKVSKAEINYAKEVKQQLYENKLNRWTSSDASVYKKEETEKVRKCLNKEWPTILYAGQNDFESGLYPYTENTKKFHSPIFESSEEAAVFLSKLAKKNHWNFIYKRHPMMRGKMIAEIPDNAIVNDNIDIHDVIDIADLTITILSQSSYVSLIRNKPALMLGFHQICDKGCVYEVKKKEDIEDTISLALREGFTQLQQKNFAKHIAQLCKYYLYSDFTNDDITYGKSLDDLVTYLKNTFELTQDEIFDFNIEETKKLESSDIHVEEFSDFTFDLSIKERFERRKIKKMLANKKKIIDYLESVSINDDFYKTLMYLSQIDAEILKENGWNDIFQSVFYNAFYEEKQNFFDFLKRCNYLNPEIIVRLQIKDNIKKCFLKMLDNEKLIPTFISWSVKCESNELQKFCLDELVRKLEQSDDAEKKMLCDKIDDLISHSDLTAREKSYLLQLKFLHNIFTVDDMKKWNKILVESEDAELLYYYGVMELDRIAFLMPQRLYDEYYRDRKKLLVHISEVLGDGKKWNTEKSIKEKNKKIAMLVVGLHGKRYASARLQAGLANELVKRGWEVTIFVADTNYIKDGKDFLVKPTTIRSNFSKNCFQTEHWEMLDADVKIKYFMNDVSGKERYQEFIDKVYAYNPRVVIDITNEQAVYNPALIKCFPVISVPLNGYSSSATCDAYITRNMKLTEQENAIFHSITTRYIYEANVYLPYSISKEPYNRSKYGISKSDFIAVTVGNRLDYEITDEIKNDMLKLLEKNCRLKWIIVGNVTPEKFSIFEKQIKNKQIILWGYENNLSSLYKMCDVYLDLPRSGGGGSTAFAVQSGIPAIIANLPSDIIPFIGEETSAQNWKGELEMLMMAMKSKVFCRKLVKIQKKNLSLPKWSVEHFTDVLESTINGLRRKKA